MIYEIVLHHLDVSYIRAADVHALALAYAQIDRFRRVARAVFEDFEEFEREIVIRHRFYDKIERPHRIAVERVPRHIGHEDYRDVAVALAQLLRRVHTARSRHIYVKEHRVVARRIRREKIVPGREHRHFRNSRKHRPAAQSRRLPAEIRVDVFPYPVRVARVVVHHRYSEHVGPFYRVRSAIGNAHTGLLYHTTRKMSIPFRRLKVPPAAKAAGGNDENKIRRSML